MGRKTRRKTKGNKEEIQKVKDQFEKYYKAFNFVPEAEWEIFMATLFEELPISFRLNTVTGFHHILLEELRSDLFGSPDTRYMYEGKSFCPPTPITWYPNEAAWSIDVGRKNLRKVKELKHLRTWLVTQQDSGNLNRQEMVSMIPPLLLGVQPSHAVLDMCAAPGSKTAQLLEALHMGVPKGGIPGGFLIANDANAMRAGMLSHQLRRLPCASICVTNHDARAMPTLLDAQGEPLLFDRILADVPCSGDGTVRKNVNIWKAWDVYDAAMLHPIQLSIGLRGAHLLKEGGYMVYSTCSFNPLENEAVVAQILHQTDGALEVVDAHGMLKGLRAAPGLTTWKVADREVNQWFETHDQVPDVAQSQIHPSMFPPQGVEAMNLHHCLRLLPHHHNTSGFFVAVLRKTKAWTLPEHLDEEKKQAEEQRKKEEDRIAEEERLRQANEGDEEAVVPANRDKRRNTYFQEDEFEPVSVARYEQILTWYGLPRELSRKSLLVRANTAKHKVYLVGDRLANLLQDKNNQGRVKVMHAGSCVLDIDRAKGVGPELRVVTEGVDYLSALMTSRCIPFSLTDMKTLSTGDTYEFTQMSERARMALEDIGSAGMGSAVGVLSEQDSCLPEGVGTISVSLMRNKTNVRAMLSDINKAFLQHALGVDVTVAPPNVPDVPLVSDHSPSLSKPTSSPTPAPAPSSPPLTRGVAPHSSNKPQHSTLVGWAVAAGLVAVVAVALVRRRK